MKEYLAHWRNELKSYLARGGNLYVVLTEKESYYVYTGTRNYQEREEILGLPIT